MTSGFVQDLLSTIVERGRRLVHSRPGTPSGDRALLDLAAALLGEKGEASGVALAGEMLALFARLDAAGKRAFFTALVERFGPDFGRLDAAVRAYTNDPSQANAIALHDAAEPRRQELIRRLNRAPHGTAALVAMRAELIELLPEHAELAPLDHDFDHLLSSWFNRGFLVLKRIEWATPAVILEKIIRYEAVHEIDSWNDLRRRIEPPDRRCYAFFHPALGDEPLIFVEVALTREIPGAIAPLLSVERRPVPQDQATTAIFYSISNCQKGLRGVSFGSFLIKQVVEELTRDLPGLKRFVTLSPVPGFARWLRELREHDPERLLGEPDRAALARLDQADWHRAAERDAALRDTMNSLAAYYLLEAKRADGAPIDPVARFHLGNGARLERIDWLGDVSASGLRQGLGFMVNYLYDLGHIEQNHEVFVKQGRVVASGAVKKLVRHRARDAGSLKPSAGRGAGRKQASMGR